MEQILEIINAIATPEFINNYNYLNENHNRSNYGDNYRNLLKKWFLFSEVVLFNDNAAILQKIQNNPRAKRIFNQPIFKNGEYNLDRRDFLNRLSD